jgi:predicted phage terminase large subunit-like protein
LSAGKARDHILATARIDKKTYRHVKIRLPQDPGQAGKDQAENFIKFLSGFSVVTERETGSKEARAEPFAAQWQHGNVDVVLGPWTEEYLNELEGFPEGKFKDQVDASADGFAELQKGYTGGPPPQNLGNTKSSYWMGR